MTAKYIASINLGFDFITACRITSRVNVITCPEFSCSSSSLLFTSALSAIGASKNSTVTLRLSRGSSHIGPLSHASWNPSRMNSSKSSKKVSPLLPLILLLILLSSIFKALLFFFFFFSSLAVVASLSSTFSSSFSLSPTTRSLSTDARNTFLLPIL